MKNKIKILIILFIIGAGYMLLPKLTQNNSYVTVNSAPNTNDDYSANNSYTRQPAAVNSHTAQEKMTGATNNAVKPAALTAEQQNFIETQKLKSDRAELQRFRELSKKNTAIIFTEMKVEEIQSLTKTIRNDEMLLKKIEAGGSGIADYKWIEANLAKRKKRLKLLTKNK